MVCFAALPAAAVDEERLSGILERHCVACHGPAVQNADLRLDSLPAQFGGDRRAAEIWQDVLNVVGRGEMPPEGAPPLEAVDLDALLTSVRSLLAEGRVAARTDARPVVVMRRLNRAEYQNTMRDLLGLDIDYVRHLPPDQASRAGFRNNGAALRVSAQHLEHYLRAARDGLRRAIVTGPPPPVHEHTASETVVDKLKNMHWSSRLGRTGTFVARVPEFPDEGEFVIRIRARATMPEGDPYPRMRVVMGYRADTQTPSRTVAEVDVTDTGVQHFEFRGRIEEYPLQSRTQSKYPGLLIWISNFYSDGKAAPAGTRVSANGAGRDHWVWPVDQDFPSIVIEEVSFKAPVFESWPPAHHLSILPCKPGTPSDERDCLKQAARHFMRRAYRRPVGQRDLAPVMSHFDAVRPAVADFAEAAREALAVALVSPSFLYRVESSRQGQRLTDHQIASRLSYFLWSTMPDDRLLRLADRGALGRAAVLRGEVSRMLDSPRSQQFVAQFTDQWLDLQGVHRVAINPNYYPDFDPTLKADMVEETRHFVKAVLRDRLSALNFLKSDFTMLNQRLARHYGVEGPRGGAFKRVELSGSGRVGGLLGHGSVLLSNSTGEDSHPVERGVWVRTALLGDPPPPPPPAVPNLAQGGADSELLPVQEQLEMHRDSPACAHCHKDIDPWGIPLEGFDAVGLRREAVTRRSGNRVETHPVDAKTTLPGGVEVDGINELSAYLATEQRRRFARALVSRMLSYALGRDIQPPDSPAIDEMTGRFERAGYRLSDLCAIIVTSELFRQG
ncbi:MAG: DUF1592 domain-containing protein [Bryobacterales bacterium]|nr:DUF1592 domain-containing protein [Bryobacterales bacterium]